MALDSCGATLFSSRATSIWVTMKTLLTVTAIIEAGAGLALAGVPSATASLLFGTPLDSAPAAGLARIGGAAILALAIVCWLACRSSMAARREGWSPR